MSYPDRTRLANLAFSTIESALRRTQQAEVDLRPLHPRNSGTPERRKDLQVRLRQPTHKSNADFLTVLETSTGDLVLLAGEVSGTDSQASFVAPYFQGVVRGMLEKNVPVPEILGFFNDWLRCEASTPSPRKSATPIDGPTPCTGAGVARGHWRSIQPILSESPSMSGCVAVVRAASQTVTLFPCGLSEVHLVDTHGWVRSCGPGGQPLGGFEGSAPSPVEVRLPAQGWLVMWSSGLEDRAAALRINPWSLAFTLLRDEKRAGTRSTLQNADDDILAAAISIGDARMEDGFVILSEWYSGNRAAEIDHLQERWQRSLKFVLKDASEEVLAGILLCLREAVLNAMIHGCRQRPEEIVTLRIQYRTRERTLRATIEDPGPGHDFDWRQHETPVDGPLPEGHRGLALIHCFASRVHRERRGASLILDFNLT